MMCNLNRAGELSRKEELAMAEHLAGCERCAKESATADRLALLRQQLGDIDLSPADAQGLTRGILERTSRRTRRTQGMEWSSLLNRFLDSLATPAFRFASSGAIALITVFSLFQSYGVLRDVRDLEARQEHHVESVNVPHLDFAVDIRPLQGTPEGTLLNRIEGHAAGGYLVIDDRHTSILRSRERALSQGFPGPPMPGADRRTIRALVSYFKENSHPVLSFTRKGV